MNTVPRHEHSARYKDKLLDFKIPNYMNFGPGVIGSTTELTATFWAYTVILNPSTPSITFSGYSQITINS